MEVRADPARRTRSLIESRRVAIQIYMSEQHRSARNSRRGAALVEGALIAAAFIFAILGALDAAQMLFFHQALRDRARAAARYAVVNRFEPDTVRNYILYNSRDPKDRPGLFGLKADNIFVERHGEGTPADSIEIRIENYPLRMFTPYLAGRAIKPRFRAIEPVESLGATE